MEQQEPSTKTLTEWEIDATRLFELKELLKEKGYILEGRFVFEKSLEWPRIHLHLIQMPDGVKLKK